MRKRFSAYRQENLGALHARLTVALVLDTNPESRKAYENVDNPLN